MKSSVLPLLLAAVSNAIQLAVPACGIDNSMICSAALGSDVMTSVSKGCANNEENICKNVDDILELYDEQSCAGAQRDVRSQYTEIGQVCHQTTFRCSFANR